MSQTEILSNAPTECFWLLWFFKLKKEQVIVKLAYSEMFAHLETSVSFFPRACVRVSAGVHVSAGVRGCTDAVGNDARRPTYFSYKNL